MKIDKGSPFWSDLASSNAGFPTETIYHLNLNAQNTENFYLSELPFFDSDLPIEEIEAAENLYNLSNLPFFETDETSTYLS